MVPYPAQSPMPNQGRSRAQSLQGFWNVLSTGNELGDWKSSWGVSLASTKQVFEGYEWCKWFGSFVRWAFPSRCWGSTHWFLVQVQGDFSKASALERDRLWKKGFEEVYPYLRSWGRRGNLQEIRRLGDELSGRNWLRQFPTGEGHGWQPSSNGRRYTDQFFENRYANPNVYPDMPQGVRGFLKKTIMCLIWHGGSM